MSKGQEFSQVLAVHVSSLMSKLEAHIHDPQVRQELAESLKQLADLKYALDESSIVAVTDSRGRIQYVNDKFCEISRYSREELIGQDHRIINSGYHDKSFMNELWSTISSGSVWRGDIRNRAKDGSYYWVNTTIVPLQDQEGRPYQYLAIRNEVTELKRVQEELQRMMKHVIDIQEEERRRFSRELHDGIGQSLFSLLIQMDRVISEQGQGAALEPLRHNVSQIIEEVRDLAWELRPSVLDDLGVVPAVRTYIENFSQHYGVQVHFSSTLRRRLAPEVETTIYRTIQEALTNIGKYADAEEAFVEVAAHEEWLTVQIRDRGKGFDLGSSRRGVGLFSMEERARMCGGRLAIDSAPGRGTEIRLELPLE